MKINVVVHITLLLFILMDKTSQKGGLKDYKAESKLGDLSTLDIDKLSEKDLDALLKDPKMTIKMNPKAELKKPVKKESKYSASYKEHLENLNKEGLNVDESLNIDDPVADSNSHNSNNKDEKGKTQSTFISINFLN